MTTTPAGYPNTFTHNVERQRGGVHRVPIHHVHSLVPGGTIAQAYAGDSQPQIFVGNWGSISIDTINQLLRIHDDVTPGGVLAAPLFSPAAIVAPMWPFMPLMWGPVTIQAGTVMNFVTNYGRYASVTIIDAATGEQIIVPTVQAADMNSFTLSPNVTITVFVAAQ